MNETMVGEKHARQVFLAVYGIVPLLCLFLAGVLVFLQFVVSRTVYPDESLPLFRSLALVNLAYASLPAEEESEETAAALLAELDLPTDSLHALSEVPKGVFPIVETTISLGSGLINATDYRADLSLPASAAPSLSEEDGPTVLVLHTHATESFYEPEQAPVKEPVLGEGADVYGYYAEGSSPRSTDDRKNMVRVGEVFCEVLEENGISAVHCKTQHDLNYSEAYANALSSIQTYLKQYPSIRYIIDLHRDSLVRDDGTKLKPTCLIDGKRTAQVMLVVGAGSSDLAQPDWRENLAVSARYQSYLSAIDETFTRPVYLRYGRFNQHLGENTMLLEVGSCGNTLEEACRASRYAAEALCEMILEES